MYGVISVQIKCYLNNVMLQLTLVVTVLLLQMTVVSLHFKMNFEKYFI